MRRCSERKIRRRASNALPPFRGRRTKMGTEWKIEGAWMKTCFVLAVVWGIFNTILFLIGFVLELAATT